MEWPENTAAQLRTQASKYLRQIGAIPQEAGLYMVDVFHDDWCDIYQARRWGTHLRQDTVIPQ